MRRKNFGPEIPTLSGTSFVKMPFFGHKKYVKSVSSSAAQTTGPIPIIFSVNISPTVATMHDISKVSKLKALVVKYRKIWSKLTKIQKLTCPAIQN